jgi:hypothetical protein
VSRLGNGPFFVADYPLFVLGAEGLVLAQVYHYGLRQAVAPPFHDRAIDVYPLPPLTEGDPRRLALAYPVYVWERDERRLRRLDPQDPSSPLPALLDGAGPADGAVIDLDDLSTGDRGVLRLSLPLVVGAHARVVVSAPGNFTVAMATPTGAADLELPAEHLRLWADLTPRLPQLWWVEMRDDAGRAVAQSGPRWLTVTPSAAPE